MAVTDTVGLTNIVSNIDTPLHFIMEVPDLTYLAGIKSGLIDGKVGITNIDRSSMLSLPNTPLGFTDVRKPEQYIILPEMPFSSSRIDFSFSMSNSYQSIIDISKLIPGINDVLFSYALGSGGQTLKDDVRTIIGSVAGDDIDKYTQKIPNKSKTGGDTLAVDWEKLMNDKSKGLVGKFVTGTVLTATEVLDFTLTLASTAGGTIIDAFKTLSLNIGADNKLTYTIGTSKSIQTGTDVASSITSGAFSKNFNAYLSPKLWAGTQEPFPSIELNISYVCKKDTRQLVQMLNWLQQIASPLVLLAPVVPFRLAFFNPNDSSFLKSNNVNATLQAATQSNPSSEYMQGIRPLTYTQRNFGYFNLTSLEISPLGMGYANNPNSEFFNSTGIPLPIGVGIKLTLEAFDPFFYQIYTPNKIYGGEAKK